MKNLTSADQIALLKLASALPAGSDERRALLATLTREASAAPGSMIRLLEPLRLMWYDRTFPHLTALSKYDIKASAGDVFYVERPIDAKGKASAGFLVVPDFKLTKSGKPRPSAATWVLPEGTRFEIL